VLFTACVVAGCLLAYSPGLLGPLFFDDVPNLVDNIFLDFDGSRFDEWRIAILSNDSGVLHRPLSMLTFAANRALTGELVPAQLKTTNLVVHLAVAGLLYQWFLALLASPALARVTGAAQQRKRIALFAAAIWLLHPLHVSTVLYAIQRMAQLAALFTVLGLLVYTRYRLRWAVRGAGSGEIISAALWLFLITLAAVLCKENGILLPWLVVAVEVFLFRGTWAGRENPVLRRAGWALIVLPLLALLLAFVLDPGWLDGRYARREFTLQERMLTQARLLWHYLHWLLVPDITAMGFHHDDIPLSRGLFSPATTALSLIAWLAAIAAAWVLRRRQALLAFGVIFFLVAHSLESSVWPLEMAYEHRNYLPAVAPCLLVALGNAVLAARVRWWRVDVAAGIVAALLLLLLGLRAATWSDEFTLAHRGVIDHPDSPRANFAYANVLFKELQRSAEAGISEDERRGYAAGSRRYFMRMHELDDRDLAALVMLYQLDNSFFPTLPDRPDWLAVIEGVSRDRRLQSSDRTALTALVKYVAGPVASGDRERVQRLLQGLAQRYTRRPWLYTLRHRLLESDPAATPDTLLALLHEGIAARPGDPVLYPYLVKHHGTQDFAAGYEAIGGWLRHDRLHRELRFMLRVLEP
jgi:hypothetical protein